MKIHALILAALLFGGSSSPVATTTFNPSDKSAGVTLSNANLTESTASVATNTGVRTVGSYSSGKKYVEFSVGLGADGPDTGFGLATGSVSLTTFTTSGGIGGSYIAGGGIMYENGNVPSGHYALGAGITAGHVIGMAADFDTKLVWFREDNGLWQNNGTADPVAEINGISFADLTGPFFVIVANQENIDNIITLNTGGQTFAFTPPSGYN